MIARTLMVQGTSSAAGKSLLVTALCRMFRQDGLRVAPFKSQNMALNSAVTPDGKEIGRAQAVQAEAAGVEPSADMNPILLKPEGERRVQVVVLGRPIGSLSAADYHERKPELRALVADALARLRRDYDLIVIEGAGSPAEINLRDRDLVNMYVARLADAPVLLVADIDRGGVFASLVGTMELLDPDDRARIAGFVINKFRGDPSLLTSGLEFLAARTGVPVVGVVPFIQRLRIADEDSVSLDDRMRGRRPTTDLVDIAVVRIPRISNHDDFEPLEHEPGVSVRFVDRPEELPGADLVVLPGSKAAVSDLGWLRETGIAALIEERARLDLPLLGICGGCQMLGEVIEDPHGVESRDPAAPGLGLLPIRTRFAREKVTARVKARSAATSLVADEDGSAVLSGYEIHMGLVEKTAPSPSPFRVVERLGQPVETPDGAARGSVVGTMIHGLFENEAVRATLLRRLRARRGLTAPTGTSKVDRNGELDRLAGVVRQHLHLDRLRQVRLGPDEGRVISRASGRT